MDDIEIRLNDITLVETDALYQDVKKLMEHGMHVDEWMLESQFGIIQGDSDSYGIIQLWRNKECILKSYATNFAQEYIPVDLVYLNGYMEERGWKFIIDSDLVRGNTEYWGRFFSAVVDPIEDDDIDDEDLDFVEYQGRIEEKYRATSNNYSIADLKEFEDHSYDYVKRSENEKEKF
jgi:hypothetical protein